MIEGHGLDPDVAVVADPSGMAGGSDAQLDAAIEQTLEEIKRRPHVKPRRPAYPDRSRFGVKQVDK